MLVGKARLGAPATPITSNYVCLLGVFDETTNNSGYAFKRKRYGSCIVGRFDLKRPRHNSLLTIESLPANPLWL
jgi:hypothetical protein